MMKVLHLCSYYIGSKVYRNLFLELARSAKVECQRVWVPIRDRRHIGSNYFEHPGVDIKYVKCLGLLTRLSFLLKQISLLLGFGFRSGEGRDFDLVHAHTLYSDGFLAYWLNIRYGIPYVLTVRTTDVSLFDRLLPHWRPLTRKVIGGASCLVFVSEAHKQYVEKRYQRSLPKTILLPNGIDDYWIENAICFRADRGNHPLRGIYLGEINRNKNVRDAILAFFSAVRKVDSHFTVVGGTYSEFESVYGGLPEEILRSVDFLERTQDKQLIKEKLLESDVLVMPSHMETFGLTYLEAISQCVPVVYTRGQGIDGLFPEGYVGFGCDSRIQESIVEAISRTLSVFPEGLKFPEGKNPVTEFSWKARAAELLDRAY